MKTIFWCAYAILFLNINVTFAQSAKTEKVVNQIIDAYEAKHAQDSLIASDERGRNDIGVYSNTVFLCQFSGWIENGRRHMLIIMNDDPKTCKIFEGRDLKTDMIALFNYLKTTAKGISTIEKNRLIMDFVKYW